MVKLNAPLGSFSASGSLGPRLVYQNVKGKNSVRHQKAQKDKITPSRIDQRALFTLCAIRWKFLTNSEKLPYVKPAISAQLTTYAYFLKLALSDPATHLGLVGFWGFNETKQGTAKDISKTGNTGTLGPSWPTNAPQYVDSLTPKNGKALQFDGNDDFVDCGTSQTLKPTEAITVEALIMFTAANQNVRVISDWHQSHSSDRWLFFISSTKRVGWYIVMQPGNRVAQVLFDIEFGKQYYFAGTWDGSQMSFYVNGILQGTGVCTGRLTTSDLSMRIGKQAESGGGHQGTITDVRVSNRGKSEAEIIETNKRFYQLK